MTSAAIAAAVLLAAFFAFLWWIQERVVFQPQGPPYPAVDDVRRVDYRAEDGQPLFAYVIGDPATSPALIAFHGNADLAAWQIEWARELARQTGHAVLLPEYRGYMGLPGRPTYAGVRLDARAAYAALVDSLDGSRDRVAVFGHSLGTAVAVELADDRPVSALLLQSPFTSTYDMTKRMITPPLAAMWRYLSRVPYDTRRLVARLDAPVSVIHGARDQIIPPWMGRAVYESAKVKGELLIVEGAGHNDVAGSDERRYWSWVRAALRVSPRSAPPAP